MLVAPDDSLLGGPLFGIVAIAALVADGRLRAVDPRCAGCPPGAGTPRRPWGDSWSDGPWLSLLAHLGMVVGVLVFTYAYLTAAV